MLAPGGEFDQPSPMLDFAIGSLGQYDEFVAELQADSGLPVEFHRTGAVQIALTNTELESLSRAPLFNAPPAFLPRSSRRMPSTRWLPWSARTRWARSTTPTKPLSIPPAL